MSEVRRGCRADTLPVCAVKSVRVKGAAVAGVAAGYRWRKSCVERVCVTRALSWRRRRRRARIPMRRTRWGAGRVCLAGGGRSARPSEVRRPSQELSSTREGGGRVAPKPPRPTRRPRVRLRTPRARGVGSRRRGWLKKIRGGEEDGALNGASARCTADSPAPSLRPPPPPPPLPRQPLVSPAPKQGSPQMRRRGRHEITSQTWAPPGGPGVPRALVAPPRGIKPLQTHRRVSVSQKTLTRRKKM